MKKNDGGFVYAGIHKIPYESETAVGTDTIYEKGITRRDWLAGLAMQGLCADPVGGVSAKTDRMEFSAWVTQKAYVIADSMIAESQKETL